MLFLLCACARARACVYVCMCVRLRLKGRERDYSMGPEIGMLWGYGFQGQVKAGQATAGSEAMGFMAK